jgi:hypothetical protein
VVRTTERVCAGGGRELHLDGLSRFEDLVDLEALDGEVVLGRAQVLDLEGGVTAGLQGEFGWFVVNVAGLEVDGRLRGGCRRLVVAG